MLKTRHGLQNYAPTLFLSPLFPKLIQIAALQNFAIFILKYTEIKTILQNAYLREFGIRNTPKKLNRQLEKVADSFGNIIDI